MSKEYRDWGQAIPFFVIFLRTQQYLQRNKTGDYGKHMLYSYSQHKPKNGPCVTRGSKAALPMASVK